MSLTIYINYKEPKKVNYNATHSACGSTMRIDNDKEYLEEYWEANITHNMTKMALNIPIHYVVNGITMESTLYDIVWHPNELNANNTTIVLKALEEAIEFMIDNEIKLLKYNPSNGWGSYDSFLTWLIKYKEACEQNLNCLIETSC